MPPAAAPDDIAQTNVNSLLNLLHKINIELTFEKFLKNPLVAI